MKKIVVMPVKNEEWILEKSLACASIFVDHIIVADQGSTDSTPDICKRFPKVIYFRNESKTLNQSHARQLLLDKTRELFAGNNVILALDADEVLTSNCLGDGEFHRLLGSLEMGQSVVLQWIALWQDPAKYRSDRSIWGNSWKHFIFRDDRVSRFSDRATSEPRMPERFLANSIKYEPVKVLHYQFVDWDRMLAKQRRYRVYDFLQKPSWLQALKVNDFYFITKPRSLERGARLAEVPGGWNKGYAGINLESFKRENFYWQEADVLAKFAEHGVRFFRWLDVWDVDWEAKLGRATSKDKMHISPLAAKDPRSIWIRMYHSYPVQYSISKLAALI